MTTTKAQRFTVYATHEGRRCRGRRFECLLLAEAEARRMETLHGLSTEIETTEVPA